MILILNRYCSNPEIKYFKTSNRLFRYIKGSLNLNIYFQKNSDNNIVNWININYNNIINKRKNIGGYVFIFNKSPIL